jgi:hypothetical protein
MLTGGEEDMAFIKGTLMSMDDEDRAEINDVFNDICEMVGGRTRVAVISALVMALEMVLKEECTPDERESLIKQITEQIKNYPYDT